jgi:ABC-type Zn uptake system ZnuABC Zn-binding protein ZnuA
MKRIALSVAILLMFASSITACQQEEELPLIVTTIPPLEAFMSSLVGDGAEVVSIMPLSESPFDFQPTNEDLAILDDADFILWNGHQMDGWIEGHLEGIETFCLLEYAIDNNLTEYDYTSPFVFLDLYAMREIGLYLAPILSEQMPTIWMAESNAYELEVQLSTLEDNWCNRFHRAKQRVFGGMTDVWIYISRAIDTVYVNVSNGIPDEIEIPEHWTYQTPDGSDDYSLRTVLTEPWLSSEIAKTNNLDVVTISTMGEGEVTYTEYADSLIEKLYKALH